MEQWQVALMLGWGLSGLFASWIVGLLRQRRTLFRLLEAERWLNQLLQQLNPPRPGFQQELRHRLLSQWETSTHGWPPADGPNTSGPKPVGSLLASLEDDPELWVTTGTASASSNYGQGGSATSDIRKRVTTIPLSTPPSPTSSTSEADGGPGVVVHDDTVHTATSRCPICDAS